MSATLRVGVRGTTNQDTCIPCLELHRAGVALSFMWYAHSETEHYLTDGPPVPDGRVLANVSLLEEGHPVAPEKKWRWEASQGDSVAWLEMDLDGWWGFGATLEDAKKAAESYLRRRS